MELIFTKLVALLFIIEFSYAIIGPRNIVVYEGQSNYSFFCSAEGGTDNIVGTGYAPKKPFGSSRLLIADDVEILPDQLHRYSLAQNNKNRTIFYTKTTEAYNDNTYHDCLIGETGYRAAVTVLANFGCEEKPVLMVKGDELKINVYVDFRTFSPFLKCQGTEGNSFKINHDLKYTRDENFETLLGTLTATFSIDKINENLKNLDCQLYYEPENYIYYRKEIEHLFLIPPIGNMDDRQPEFYFAEDQEKLSCSYQFHIHYGPENVTIEEKEENVNILICSYSGNFTTHSKTIWTINGSIIQTGLSDTLNISSYENIPISVQCMPCVLYFNDQESCVESNPYLKWQQNTTPPPLSEPILPRNIAVYEGSSNFSFECNTFPLEDVIINASAYGYTDNGNRKYMADENSIIKEERYRYKMSHDRYNTRKIVYNSSTSDYEDNHYHECIIGDIPFRATFALLSNLQCSNNLITVIEDEKLNIELQLTFTHFTPSLGCKSNDNAAFNISYSTRVLESDFSKPYKARITSIPSINSISRNTESINCSFVYHPEEELSLEDSIHFNGIPPFNIFDNHQPEFAFMEDKKKVECNYKINVQYGPEDISLKILHNQVTCDFDGVYENFEYIFWTLNDTTIQRYDTTVDLRDFVDPLFISCRPCVSFYSSEIKCSSSAIELWKPSDTTAPPPSEPFYPINIAVYEDRRNFSFSCGSYKGFSPNRIAYGIDDDLNLLLIADGNGLVSGQENKYILVEEDSKRKVIYTLQANQYKDNIYHDCYIGPNIYRGTFSVLSDFQCKSSSPTYLALGDKSKIDIKVSFTHFSPIIVCLANADYLIETEAITNYTIKENGKILEGTVTGNVIVSEKNVNKLLCGFLYDSSNIGKMEELLHLISLAPNSLIDSFQPNVIFTEDSQKVICEFPVVVEYGPENTKCQETNLNSRKVICIFDHKAQKSPAITWKVNDVEISNENSAIIDLTTRLENLKVECTPCIQFHNMNRNCSSSNPIYLPSVVSDKTTTTTDRATVTTPSHSVVYKSKIYTILLSFICFYVFML
ncbi:DgyrCDS1707 [Dimorphilus gyrociliatus]|uniref:DgyrCDS1707 n=1 Tax=Dimorphilus gyrociliatus TaxID=2664684 RepID=A0A7I8V8D0_9ANNE|nr:DgyrCDS1707 [Dimorphilus gyrociliatus]